MIFLKILMAIITFYFHKSLYVVQKELWSNYRRPQSILRKMLKNHFGEISNFFYTLFEILIIFYIKFPQISLTGSSCYIRYLVVASSLGRLYTYHKICKNNCEKCVVGYFASLFCILCAPFFAFRISRLGWRSHEKSKDFVVYFFAALIKTKFT